MLARGNSDAATHLRRAKSTSSVTKHNSAAPPHDTSSTHNNAKTAAARAYEAAHGFITDGCGPKARRKSKSDGPGSHFARQRLQARRVTNEQNRTPRRKPGFQNLSAETTPQSSSSKQASVSHANISYRNPQLGPAAMPNERSNLSYTQITPTKIPQLSKKLVSRSKDTSYTSNTNETSANAEGSSRLPSDGFEEAPLFIGSASDGLGDISAFSTASCAHTVECLDESNVASPSQRPPHAIASTFFTKSRVRSRNSAQDASVTTVDSTINNRNQNKTSFRQTVQRIPSSLSAVKDACKRRLGRASRTSSAQTQLPCQQVEPRRSHHFGSSRLSHRSIFAGFTGEADSSSRPKHASDQPTSPSRLGWLAASRPGSAAISMHYAEGTILDSSRIPSWDNTSGFGTAKFSDHPILNETHYGTQESAALKRLHLRHQASYSSIPKFKVPRRKCSSGFNTPGVDTQRVYSALIKRINETDDFDADTTREYRNDDQTANEHAVELPPLPEMSPTPTHRSSRTAMGVKDCEARHLASQSNAPQASPKHDVLLDKSANSLSQPTTRDDVASPSVYSPYPRAYSSAAKMSMLSLDDHVPKYTGTAIVSPSRPFVSYSLDEIDQEVDNCRVVTSGQWRDWANNEMSGLESTDFRPPSIHIRGPTEDASSPEPPKPPPHGDPSLIHPASRPKFHLNSTEVTSEDKVPGHHHVPQKTDNIQSRQPSGSSVSIRRPSSSFTLHSIQNNKAFSFARRPSFITIDKPRAPSNQLSPLREQKPSLGNIRTSLPTPNNDSGTGSNCASSRAKTPEWVPSLRNSASQPLRSPANQTLQENKPPVPSPLTNDFLHSIRKGPYAESAASSNSTRTTPSPNKMARTPKDLAELRMRRTRRGRKSLGSCLSLSEDGNASNVGDRDARGENTENTPPWSGESGKKMVEGFLKERGAGREDGAFV